MDRLTENLSDKAIAEVGGDREDGAWLILRNPDGRTFALNTDEARSLGSFIDDILPVMEECDAAAGAFEARAQRSLAPMVL